MAIRRISELDPYLSGNNSTTEVFNLDTFKQSLFEISKLKSADPNYWSRQIDGDTLISAMYSGLSGFFANTRYLESYSAKLAAVLELFGGYTQSNGNFFINSFTLPGTITNNIAGPTTINGDTTIDNLTATNLTATYFNSPNDLSACALSAKWN